MHVDVSNTYSEAFANLQNIARFLIANSRLKTTYSHIKNAASIRYCMKVDLVVITVGGNMRPKGTAAFNVQTFILLSRCHLFEAFVLITVHGNSPDSNNVHTQLLSFLQKVSTVLEGATETHAHLISLA